VSGNPAGRPRRGESLAEKVRELVDPAEIVEFLAHVMRSSTVGTRDRLQAAKMLLDRGWGKPLQEIHVGGDGSAAIGDALRGISDERLEAALHLLTNAGDEPAPAVPRGVIDAHSRDGGV
jgi:hypothetical protein